MRVDPLDPHGERPLRRREVEVASLEGFRQALGVDGDGDASPLPPLRAPAPRALDDDADPREAEDWFLRMSAAEQQRMREAWRWERAAPQREAAFQRQRARRDAVAGAILNGAMLMLQGIFAFAILRLPMLLALGVPVGALAGWSLWRLGGGRFVASVLGGFSFAFTNLVVGVTIHELLFGTFGAMALWSFHGMQREHAWSLEGRPIDAGDPMRAHRRAPSLREDAPQPEADASRPDPRAGGGAPERLPSMTASRPEDRS